MKHAVLGFLAFALGCNGTQEALSPVPVTTTSDAGPTTGSGGSGGTSSAGPVVRTVEQRNPFGNVAERENLLWDGDFEWSSPFSDEYGWLAGPPFDYSFPNVRIGVACRSGIKCAAVPKSQALLGVAVASQSNKLEVSFWAHLAKGTCKQVRGVLTGFQSTADGDVTVKPVAPDPDASGWCHYDSVVSKRNGKPALYIQNSTGDEIVVDDAVIKVAPASTMMATSAPAPLEPDLIERLVAARADLARLRGPHDRPPNAARRAYESWKQP